jgi:hypothetical protein
MRAQVEKAIIAQKAQALTYGIRAFSDLTQWNEQKTRAFCSS